MESFADFIIELLQDPNVYLLRDRAEQPTFRSHLGSILRRNKKRSRSILHYQQECIARAMYWRDYHLERKTDRMRFGSAPHTWGHYIQGRVAEYLGIPCFFELESRIRGFVFIGRDFGRSPYLVPVAKSMRDESYLEAAREFISRSEKNYSDVIPDYESRRLEVSKGKHYSLGRQLQKHWSRPLYVLNYARCWEQMRLLSKPLSAFDSVKFVVVFPHYQPERTSVPEAYGFAQQQLMILALRYALPSDVHILVKEHPSTFTNQCAPIARWPEWYQTIANMNNVDFVDIETDNFGLIDRAVATATLSGTVATESLLRGTPTMVFGLLKWFGCYGQHHYVNDQQLVEFLAKVLVGKIDRKRVRESIIHTILAEESAFAIQKNRADFPEVKAEVIDNAMVSHSEHNNRK